MGLGSGLSAQLGIAEEVYTNEVQTLAITGTPTGGTITFTYDGATTSALAFNAAAAAVQAAFEALPNIGTGGVSASGGPFPGSSIALTFQGPLVSKRNVPAITIGTNSLTGGTSPTATITQTTPGSGYGDYIAPTRFLEHASDSLALEIDYIRGRGLRAGNRVQRSDRTVQNRKGAGGSIPFDVLTKGFGLLFKHMFGASVITTPGGGTNTRDHTYTLGDLFNQSLSIQKGVPRLTGGASNVDAFSYVGCKIVSWKLQNDVDGLLTLDVTVDAKDEDVTRTLGAASYATAAEDLSFVGGQITVAGANADVRSFSLEGTNPMKTDRNYLRASSLKKEQIQNDLVPLTGSMEMDYDGHGRSVYDRFVSGVPVAVTALWEASLIESTFKYGLLITLPAVRFTGETAKVDGPDVVMQSLPFEVLYDGTNEPITARYRTTDTTD